jgi:uncharacterized protein with PIN domain
MAEGKTEDTKRWRCAKCDTDLVKRNVIFTYLGMSFSHEVLCCPKCRKVFIPKELAEGKMMEVEKLMEDK